MITDTMYIGSGDTAALLANKASKAHALLMQRFVSGIIPFRNSLNSPIDALRAGAILESRYISVLPGNYLAQYYVQCSDMDVLSCHLDFAKVENGKVIDFIELKTCSLFDFVEIEETEEYIIRKYKHYYWQVQQQLLCTGLSRGRIRFVARESENDKDNYSRVFSMDEHKEVIINRNEDIISRIKQRADIFQQIKNYFLANDI